MNEPDQPRPDIEILLRQPVAGSLDEANAGLRWLLKRLTRDWRFKVLRVRDVEQEKGEERQEA